MMVKRYKVGDEIYFTIHLYEGESLNITKGIITSIDDDGDHLC
jgi:hypothetical protein